MTKSEIFITLINSCKDTKNRFNIVNTKMMFKDPEKFFGKKKLLELYNTLSLEEKENFKNIQKFYDLAVSVNVITKDRLHEGCHRFNKCCVCGKETKFVNLRFGYKRTCSKECRYESTRDKHLSKTSEEKQIIDKKRKQTSLNKYGVDNYFQTDEFKEKAKQTKLEKYGNENYVNLEKIKQTKLEKYGNENYNNRPKMKKTKLEKYGDENYINLEKMKQTKLEKYGDVYYNNHAKYKETCLEKFNTDNFAKSTTFKDNVPNYIEKRDKTTLEKYGAKNIAQAHIKNLELLDDLEFIKENFTEGKKILKHDIIKFFDICDGTYQNKIMNPLRDEGYTTKRKLSLCENKFLSDIEKTSKISLKRQYQIPGTRYFVDGYDPKTNTVYEFLGDYWHGNPDVFDLNDLNKTNNRSFKELYDYTFMRLKCIKDRGYKVVFIWESNYKNKGLKFIKEI